LLRPQQQQQQQQCQPALQQQRRLVATSAASAEVEAATAPAAAAAAAGAQPTANLVSVLRGRGLLQDVTSEDLEKVTWHIQTLLAPSHSVHATGHKLAYQVPAA
jgi:hypothetical protein